MYTNAKMLTEGATGSALRAKLVRNGADETLPIGSVVTVRLVDVNNSANVPLNNAACTIEGTGPYVNRAWGASTPAVGSYRGQFKVAYPDGTVDYFPSGGRTFSLVVKKPL